MSTALQITADSSTIDWHTVGSAVGVGLVAVITGMYGWFKGEGKSKRKHEGHIKAEGSDIQVAGAVLQDNQSLRENTDSNRALRDQVMLLIHVLERNGRTQEEMVNALEDAVTEIKRLRTTI
jgi:hypothetical protein